MYILKVPAVNEGKKRSMSPSPSKSAKATSSAVSGIASSFTVKVLLPLLKAIIVPIDVIRHISGDVLYLDPPYTGTMNNYFGLYGPIDDYITGKKQIPFKNNFVKKNEAITLFDNLFSNLKRYKYWALSYNSTSFPKKEQLLEILNKYSKEINVLEKEYAYKVTGKKNKNLNKEYLFIIKNPLIN